MSAPIKQLSEYYINPNLVFKKSILIAKNIQYFDIREVSYTNEQKRVYTKLGICLPISTARDLIEALEESRASRNRVCVRNCQDQYFFSVQTLDHDTTIVIVKKLSTQFCYTVFLTSTDVSAILKQLQ